MSGIHIDLLPELTQRRALVGWMLISYLVTFLATRAITRAIKTGRGPFRNANLGGVHVHHQVYGIFLILGAGTAEFTYRPASPWADVLAVLFGMGAALTLDEFALWLHLQDVYWEREGRSSVDAVLVALIVGVLLLLGVNPFGEDSGGSAVVTALGVATNLVFALVAILKGRPVLGVVGVFVPFLALAAALRLARPNSPWARARYDERRMERARRRFPPGRRSRWDRLVDLFAGSPALPGRRCSRHPCSRHRCPPVGGHRLRPAHGLPGGRCARRAGGTVEASGKRPGNSLQEIIMNTTTVTPTDVQQSAPQPERRGSGARTVGLAVACAVVGAAVTAGLVLGIGRSSAAPASAAAAVPSSGASASASTSAASVAGDAHIG
ncbi:hypothetical protein, partial [Pseudonocardia zijingensis]